MDNENILNIKKQKVIFSPASTKLSLSRKLLKTMGITPEKAEVQVIYTDNSVIIKNLPSQQKIPKELLLNNLSFFDFELREKQLLFLLIQEIKEENLDNTLYCYQLKKIKSLLKLDRNSYEVLYQIIDSICKKSMFIFSPDNKLEKISMFDSISYINEFKNIEVYFGKTAIKIFKDFNKYLNKNYTENILKLTKKNSIELYLKAEINLFKGDFLLKIEDIKRIFNVNYKASGEIKRALINKCVEDINNNTDLNISLEDIKEGKEITGFIFYVKRKNY